MGKPGLPVLSQEAVVGALDRAIKTPLLTYVFTDGRVPSKLRHDLGMPVGATWGDVSRKYGDGVEFEVAP